MVIGLVAPGSTWRVSMLHAAALSAALAKATKALPGRG